MKAVLRCDCHRSPKPTTWFLAPEHAPDLDLTLADSAVIPSQKTRIRIKIRRPRENPVVQNAYRKNWRANRNERNAFIALLCE